MLATTVTGKPVLPYPHLTPDAGSSFYKTSPSPSPPESPLPPPITRRGVPQLNHLPPPRNPPAPAAVRAVPAAMADRFAYRDPADNRSTGTDWDSSHADEPTIRPATMITAGATAQGRPLTHPVPLSQQVAELGDDLTNADLICTAPWGLLCTDNGDVHELDDALYRVGRNEHCEIVIDTHITVSKVHFRLTRAPEPGATLPATGTALPPLVALIEDLSTNGTHVNGTRLQRGVPTPLRHADEITIKVENGALKFTFEIPSAPEPSASSSASASAASAAPANVYHHQDPQFESVLQGIDFHRILGSGTYATVYLAVDRHTKEKYACKALDKFKAGLRSRGSPANNGHEELAEIRILMNLKHPNIVQVHQVLRTERYIYMFLQLVEGGELFDYLSEHLSIPETECKFWMYQLFQAIQYLHAQNISHRDIKPENILLETGQAGSKLLLADFGLAKKTSSRMKTMCGTLNYVAPEILTKSGSNGPGYSKAVDCWSCGVMLYFLLCGRLPFDDTDEDVLRQMIKEDELAFLEPAPNTEIWDGVSEQCKNLIRRLLAKDPARRLTIAQALAHPWIASDRALLDAKYQALFPASQPPGDAPGGGGGTPEKSTSTVAIPGAWSSTSTGADTPASGPAATSASVSTVRRSPSPTTGESPSSDDSARVPRVARRRSSAALASPQVGGRRQAASRGPAAAAQASPARQSVKRRHAGDDEDEDGTTTRAADSVGRRTRKRSGSSSDEDARAVFAVAAVPGAATAAAAGRRGA
ncbi:CAMK/RAD53 protein kinase [Allomyces macrogynus ATCC 38327]|uniref:CAMK/RAD53 protein kinase n=1 Tax=Allomyces macrogynus (strain ATCC 38327) TaxID=578462 RepID=A0A0L0S7X9_ALLM3|nr:CAMK/RAD53 protein kinase [Allomyces macrogynus ATCC 38327]|eukprot:KNE58708.1 CAMK/RAD53 protein kinase [Allomyces macrogynus ATCC 38327]